MQVYSFGLGTQSSVNSPEVLGGKGAGLVWLDSNGFDVPPGFILPTFCWAEYKAQPKTFMKAVAKEIKPYLNDLKQHFGYMPLLSVRSGARLSMPGMLDTILNIGIDHSTRGFWLEKLGFECVQASESRLIQMFGSVVKGVDKTKFDRCETSKECLTRYEAETNALWPDAQGQLIQSIEAVFNSWDNARAKIYRKLHNIPDDWGTAVVVQAMVFGNMNDQSGTGVLFTRNPDTGDDTVVGEFLVNAQGEDVVDGSHTPMPLTKMPEWNSKVAKELLEVADKLEKLKGDTQDVEFTIQDGKLYVLQTRNAKRSPTAALRIAVEMYEAGLIDYTTLRSRVSAREYDLAQQKVIDPAFKAPPMAHGIPACSGVATGKVVFTAKAAIDCKGPCILVTQETNPDDIGGMFAAKAIVTMQGGHTCHAAVVARGMNKPCIVGVGMALDQFKGKKVLSVNGATGAIWDVAAPIIDGSKNVLVQRYADIIRNNLGYVPIVDGPITGHLPEVMFQPHCSTHHFEQDKATIQSLLEHCDRLYVDLRENQADASEKEFFRFFDTNYSPAHLHAFLSSLPLTTDTQKIVIVAGSKAYPTLNYLVSVDSLQELVLAEGEVLVNVKDKPEVVQKVMNWKLAEGLQPVSYGVLTPGTKSFLSDAAALQVK